MGWNSGTKGQGAHWPLPHLPPLCLNREHSPIPTHLKQVLFQGNQGAGPERSCSPASSAGTGPGFRTQVEEAPVGSPPGQRTGIEIKVGEPPAWGPSRQLSPGGGGQSKWPGGGYTGCLLLLMQE